MKRVLVIDDNPDIRLTAQALLEAEGFQVSVARDGAEALALQRASPFDVVVTDIYMPGMEGVETIHELRKHFPATRILAMSGGGKAGKVDYMQVARQLGAAKTLRKPFVPRELVEAVRELAFSR